MVKEYARNKAGSAGVGFSWGTVCCHHRLEVITLKTATGYNLAQILTAKGYRTEFCGELLHPSATPYNQLFNKGMPRYGTILEGIK